MCATLVALLTYSFGFAQDDLPEIGETDRAWLTENAYAADSSVHAYVIAQHTRSGFELDTRLGWRVRTNVRRIVKIVDRKGYDQATVRIQFWDRERTPGTTTIRKLKAFTFSLENGVALDVAEVDKKDIYRTRLNPFMSEVTFSLPKVKEGSVLDISYEVEPNSLSLQTAVLQEDIPMKSVTYELRAHEQLDITGTQLGYHPIEATTEFVNTRDARVIHKDRLTRYSATDVPAAKPEPYITTMRNYVAHVVFDLRGFSPSMGPYVDFGSNWAKIAEGLLENANLKAAMRGKGYYKDWATNCPANATTKRAKANWAFEEVSSRVRHTSNSSYVSDKPKGILDEGEATSADINSLFIGLCNALGVQAEPIFISTRDHGRLLSMFPARTAFNHLIAAVTLDNDKRAYVDASAPAMAVGILPDQDLNGQGFCVGLTKHEFVDLQKRAVAQRSLIADLTLSEDHFLEGEIQYVLKGYGAADLLTLDNGARKLLTDALPGFEAYILTKVEVTEKSAGEDYTITAQVRSEEPALDLGGALAVSPLVIDSWKRNPFAREERKYPVEFTNSIVETRSITITLPESMQPEELPASVALETPDGGSRFRYSLKSEGSALKLSTMFAIKKLQHLPEDYASLRQFFTEVSAKQQELVSVVPKV